MEGGSATNCWHIPTLRSGTEPSASEILSTVINFWKTSRTVNWMRESVIKKFIRAGSRAELYERESLSDPQ